MKRRIIYWVAGILTGLILVNCHWVARPLRKADAILTVQTTGYCACSKCSGWRFSWFGLPVTSNGKVKIVGQTASTRMAHPGTVAIDPKVFPVGTKFYIPGYGWARGDDRGGRVRGRHIDLYFRRHRSAIGWGTKTQHVKVWYPAERSGR
jgi:3D (Asp-Asp-Asp) domain-containing protein